MNVQHKIVQLERKARVIKIGLQKSLKKRDELYEQVMLSPSEHKQLVASLEKIYKLHVKLTIVLTELHLLKDNEESEPFNLLE